MLTRPFRFTIWAIVAALVLVFFVLPNFMPVKSRSKISRIKADQRSLATALEAYFADNQAYPATRPLREFGAKSAEALKKAGGFGLPTIEPGRGMTSGLTTPVSYITALYPEPYFVRGDTTGSGGVVEPYWFKLPGRPRRHRPLWPYPYYNDRNLGWIVWACGPDNVYDITDPKAVYDAADTSPSAALMELTYDPTNGSSSRGDIWRTAKPSHAP